MKPTTIVVALCVLIVITGATILSSVNQPHQDVEFEGWKGRHSLRSIAREARARGQHKVSIPAPDFEYADDITIDEALSSNSVIIAEPIEAKTFAHGSDAIRTWYKFRTVETLSQVDYSCPTCPSVNPPEELFPLNPDEFLVCTAGGSLVIDGVQVNMVDADFPPFERGKRYLLLASITPKGFARIGSGPTGVFTVSDSGAMEPINKKPHRIKSAIEGRFGSSIVRFKETLKSNHR